VFSMTIFSLNISMSSNFPHIHSFLFSLHVLSSIMSFLVTIFHPISPYKYTSVWVWLRVRFLFPLIP
jgi:hypothetical protein